MIFSRYQLNQLVGVNGININSLISKQKQLMVLTQRRNSLHKTIKDVTSSSSKPLPVGSSLFMGRINTRLLIDLGYSDIGPLIKKFNDNEDEINRLKKEVSKVEEKIKGSLDTLKDVDVTKDMKDQITKELILDSDLAEVKHNSSEILLMLSQSNSTDSIYAEAETQIAKNEAELAQFIGRADLANTKLFQDMNKKIEMVNESTSSMKQELEDLAEENKDVSLLEKAEIGLSMLPPTYKNVILGGTFFTLLAVGLAGGGSSKKPTTGEENDKKNKLSS